MSCSNPIHGQTVCSCQLSPRDKQSRVIQEVSNEKKDKWIGEITGPNKASVSNKLKAQRIPNVRHRLFSLSHKKDWAEIHAYAQKCRYHLVCKPKKRVSSLRGFHVTNSKELDSAVMQLALQSQELILCRFKKIKSEYRLILLDQKAELIMRKVPPFIIGDGQKKVSELLASFLEEMDPQLAGKAVKSIPLSMMNSSEIPQINERIPLQWMHSLGLGARCVLLGGRCLEEYMHAGYGPDPLLEKLTCLAMRAASAVEMHFASVDIVELEGEYNEEKKFQVLEVNGEVVLEDVINQWKDLGRKIAKKIYSKAMNQPSAEPKT